MVTQDADRLSTQWPFGGGSMQVKMDIAVYTLPPTGKSDGGATEGPTDVVTGLQVGHVHPIRQGLPCGAMWVRRLTCLGSALQVVDVKRKEGDPILFHRLYQKLQSKVQVVYAPLHAVAVLST